MISAIHSRLTDPIQAAGFTITKTNLPSGCSRFTITAKNGEYIHAYGLSELGEASRAIADDGAFPERLKAMNANPHIIA